MIEVIPLSNEQKEKTEQKKFTTVSIPTPLFKKVEEKLKGTEFTSVSEYVTYILNEIAVEEEEEEEPERTFTEDDEKRIKARLRDLGYID